MLNIIWISFFLLSFLAALYQVVAHSNTAVFSQMMDAAFSMSKTGFEISIGLTGILTFWLGIMKVGEAGGMVALLTRLVSPVFRRLFPDVPHNHPAVGAMMLNLSANMLGLDNAATPLGLKAMKELQSLNSDKETASNAQIMFLVINTSAVTIIPITIITYLYQLGYQNPTEVFIPILIATFCSTLAGVLATCLVQRINLLRSGILGILGGAAVLVALLVAVLLQLEKEQLQTWSLVGSNCFIFCIIILFVSLAACRKVNVYEEFIVGAKEGFQVAITIIPYLIAMLVAIGIFRASGAMDVLLAAFAAAARGVTYVASLAGLGTYTGTNPVFIDALPTALMKPLSGSGARGLMIETIKTNGVDALVSKMVAVIQGSTETTFYVLAVYFGSVGIRKTRHAVLCGLIADGTGVIAAISICYLFFK
jgi:spore maturation protein SpmA